MWIKDLNVKNETLICLAEKKYVNIFYTVGREGCLKRQKALVNKYKMNKFDYIKNFCLFKRQPKESEKTSYPLGEDICNIHNMQDTDSDKDQYQEYIYICI